MSEKLKITRGSGNVFRDIGFDKDEAENLKLRSELMIRIESFYEKSGMTQAQAARLLGLTAPRFKRAPHYGKLLRDDARERLNRIAFA